MLAWIAEAPRFVPGIVDVDAGVIRIAAVDPRARRATWMRIGAVVLGTFVAAAALPVAANALGDTTRIGGLPPLDSLALWFWMVIGAGGHSIIDVIKQARSEEDRGVLATDDVTLWLHVNEREMIIAIVSLLFVFGA